MNVRDEVRRRIRARAAEPTAGPLDADCYYQRRGPGSRNRMRWFFSGIWLVYLIQPVAALFSGRHSALWIAGGLAIVAVFCSVYVGMCTLWDRTQRWAQCGLAVIAVLAVLACVIYGNDWTSLWIYVSVATGFAVPGRRAAMLAVLAVAACYVLLSWVAHAGAPQFLIILVPTVLAGWAMTGIRMQIALIRELGQARDTVARLAANQERLRLARDLHDLAGHSLSLITLKAELAQRMLDRLPASAERDRAARDAADIERVSRQTLHDIREAVSGYRRPTLAVEVATARTALEAAGVHLDAEPALPETGAAGPDEEAALAWCLREAVTNVIRHSGAASCRIRLLEGGGELSLDVTDDGRGIAGFTAIAAAPASSAADMPQAGSGLRGMSERLSAVGGRLSAGPARDAGAAGRGFRLIATVPAAGPPSGGGQPPDGRSGQQPAATGQAILNTAP